MEASLFGSYYSRRYSPRLPLPHNITGGEDGVREVFNYRVIRDDNGGLKID